MVDHTDQEHEINDINNGQLRLEFLTFVERYKIEFSNCQRLQKRNMLTFLQSNNHTKHHEENADFERYKIKVFSSKSVRKRRYLIIIPNLDRVNEILFAISITTKIPIFPLKNTVIKARLTHLRNILFQVPLIIDHNGKGNIHRQMKQYDELKKYKIDKHLKFGTIHEVL